VKLDPAGFLFRGSKRDAIAECKFACRLFFFGPVFLKVFFRERNLGFFFADFFSLVFFFSQNSILPHVAEETPSLPHKNHPAAGKVGYFFQLPPFRFRASFVLEFSGLCFSPLRCQVNSPFSEPFFLSVGVFQSGPTGHTNSSSRGNSFLQNSPPFKASLLMNRNPTISLRGFSQNFLSLRL